MNISRAHFAILALGLSATAVVNSAQARSSAEQYVDLCAGCHTTDARSFFSASTLVTSGAPAEITAVIREGRPARGMPAFGTALTPSETRAMAAWLKSAVAPRRLGSRIEAEDLRVDRSAGFSITQEGDTRFLQWIDRGSHLCYDDVDLTGVRSVEYRYAKGEGEPPRRFALVAFAGEFGHGKRYPLGEKPTELTGGWTTFRVERIGLARQLEGRHRLCVIGMGGGGVFNLDWLALSDAAGTNDGITNTFEARDEIHRAGGHAFRLEKLGEIDGEFWSVDFLDEQTLAATQKSGSLWLFRGGQRMGPVADIPPVYFMGQGGLLSVRLHPGHARNGWVYLSYTTGGGGKAGLAIARGRIRDGRWVDHEVIYQVPTALFSGGGEHFGGRLTFDGDYLFFSMGERGHQEQAQELGNPFGKIHRIFADGRVPPDNPFSSQPGAVPSIWTLGHRNPQGLFFDARARRLWSTEHGPKGGDEINEILRGRNYGWPLVTHGINYDGSIVSEVSEREGFESPRRHWNPSPGLSNLVLYDAPAFPKWRGHLLMATLAHQKLELVEVQGGRVLRETTLLENQGRIRDVIVAADGMPVIALNQPNGQLYRLRPVTD